MADHLRLAPYDRMFLASHMAQRRRGLLGHPLLAWLDLRGRPDRAALVNSLRQAMAVVPHTTAKIAYSTLTARARWQLNGMHLDPVPLECHDVRGQQDPATAQEALMQSAFARPLDPSASPQIRLLHIQTHDERHRLVLHWPHYLMDLEGAQMFLAVLAGRDAPDDVRGAQLNGAAQEYPPDWSGRFVRRWAQGLRRVRSLSRMSSIRFKSGDRAGPPSAHFLVRQWRDDVAGAISQAARQVCAPGPMLYTRHYIMALVRAMDDFHGEPGFHSREQYVVPLPMLRPRRGNRRVIARNDLTIATLVIPRESVAHPAEFDALLARQIGDYTSLREDEAMWVMMEYAGWLRSRHYQWMLERRRTFPRYSVGFTSFRADDWASGFMGCGVDNFNVCGMPPIPPGIIASFCRIGSRLNLSLSYYSHVCSPALAQRLADRIELHLGASRCGPVL